MALALYGERNANLKIIERETGVELHARGNELTVVGDPAKSRANWSHVRTVRVGLLLRGPLGTETATPVRTWHPLGEATASDADAGSKVEVQVDRRLRQTVTFTVALRNPPSGS